MRECGPLALVREYEPIKVVMARAAGRTLIGSAGERS